MLSRAAWSGWVRRFVTAFKDWLASGWAPHYLRTKLSDLVSAKNQQIADLQRELLALKTHNVAPVLPTTSLADQLLAQVRPPAVDAPIAPAPEPASMPAAGLEPAIEQAPAEFTEPQPESAMTTETPQTEPAPRHVLPDVKLLAPILKIALATLSIEQMVEIGLHIKMGSPGFKEFLDSEIARTKFRELYAVYCEFLAGRVK
jgi:hypothetical protein